MLASESAPSTTPKLLWLVHLLLAVEITAAVLLPHPWFHIQYLYRGVPVFFLLTLFFFGRAQLRHIEVTTFSIKGAAIHISTLALLAGTEIFLIATRQQATARVFESVKDVWLVLIIGLVPSLLFTFFPLEGILKTSRGMGVAWLYTAICSIALVVFRDLLSRSWESGNGIGILLQITAFRGARYLLALLYPTVVSDVSIQLLGTPRFQILIGSACSGVQGLALLSVLMVTWLCFARRNLRPARVLLLGCSASVVLWALNIVRLVTLIAIGDSGHSKVALNGFHSEAGWIALTVVTLGCLMATERISWFRKPRPLGRGATAPVLSGLNTQAVRNVPAIYLSPFLAITGASVLSQAVSGGFEWLYPIRLLAPLAMFWLYRTEYRRMSFRFGPKSAFAGLAVAILWIGAHYFQANWTKDQGPLDSVGGHLAALSQGQRALWVSCRLLAAVVTVPVAEELAFRGYLARYLVSSDVEAVPYANLSTFALIVSAICFGLMHGWMWAPGIASGLVFGLLARSRNRIGDAIAAHATANLAIAAWVLLRSDYSLW